MEEIKIDLKLKLRSNIEDVFQTLDECLKTDSKLFDNYILITSRYQELKRESENNLINYLDKNVELAKIKGAMMSLINDLDESDIETSDKLSSNLVELIDDEDIGLIDCEELINESFTSFSNTLVKMTEYTTEVGEAFSKSGEEVKLIQKIGNFEDRSAIKRVLDEFAKRMDNYYKQMNREIPILKKDANSGIDYILKYIEIIYENKLNVEEDSFSHITETINELKVASKGTKNSIYSFEIEIKKLANLTSKIKRAKKSVIQVLSDIIQILNDFLNKIEKTEENLEYILLEIRNENL